MPLKPGSSGWPNRVQIPNIREWLFVAGIFLVANVINCVYFAFGGPPSGAFGLLYLVAINWVIAAWVLADCRRLHTPQPFDLGWFVFFAWPVVLPYHAFKTRGVRGFALLAGFAGLFALSYVIGLVLFFIIIAVR